MPDISMCANSKCPLRETCYRYTATPSKYQTYSSFSPTYVGLNDHEPNESGWRCEYYWPTKEGLNETNGSG